VKDVPVELQLLLACARVTIDADEQGHIQRLAAAGPDWELLILTARRHGLCSLLHRTLSAVNHEQVPSVVMEQLTTLASNYRSRNLMLVAELLRVIAILENVGIRAIPYKGPALAQYVYRDFALREFVDLDILIKPCDAVRARRVLMSAGLPPANAASRLAEQLYRYFHCEFAFVLLREVKLEVNWRLAPAYWLLPQLGDKVWDRLGQLQLAGAVTARLDQNDLLITLCIHGSKHIWDTLKWLVDVAELVRSQPGLDWVSLQSKAERIGATVMLEIGLVLAHDLLQAPVPAEVLETARNRPKTIKLVSEIRERSFAKDNAPSKVLQELPFVARAVQKPGAKVMLYLLMPAYFILHRFIRPAGAQLLRLVGGADRRSAGATPKT
jgi:hypothetical protein